MKEILSRITAKGHVTIPAEVPRHLGLHPHEKVAFVIGPKGHVELRAPKYPDLDSLAGAAGKLDQPRSWEEMREIALEDHAQEVLRSAR